MGQRGGKLMSVVAYLPQKESGLKRQPAQFIRGGIPVKSGYFMRVFDTDGKFIVAGQMIKWSKSPAMMTIERRVSNPHSNSYRLFGMEESKTYYDIPLSIVGGVELEPGITLNKTDICYFHGKIKTVKKPVTTWNPERCVPLQVLKKFLRKTSRYE